VFLIYLVAKINENGFLPVETLSLVITALLVFVLTVLSLKKEPIAFSLKKFLVHGMPPVILAFILLFFARGTDSRIFSDFRDVFLMSNRVGMTINDFYYRYTLAPAEVFKSMDLKEIKTCVIKSDDPGDPAVGMMTPFLLQRDYLVLETCADPDLLVSVTPKTVSLIHHGRVIVEKQTAEFLSNVPNVLTEYSKRTDVYSGYRNFIALSLITGLPLLMYLMIHGLILALARLFMKQSAPVAASFIVPLIGLVSFTALYILAASPVSRSNLRDHLTSASPMNRVEGLKFMAEHRINPSEYPDSRRALESPHVLERYWYARALSANRSMDSYAQLLKLVDDPHPNVQCQAFYSLGNIGNKGAVEVIIDRIKVSRDWYSQWYAYKSLKRLGWIQQK
jgi:hypothetical protein